MYVPILARVLRNKFVQFVYPTLSLIRKCIVCTLGVYFPKGKRLGNGRLTYL